MNLYRYLYMKLREKSNPIFGALRRRKLTNTPFTIISNNCWGAHCYRYYQLPYDTPTVGLYIYSEDYLRLLKRLEYYMSLELVFIPCEQSKHADSLKAKGEENVPIGLLDDVEIVFLHYKSEKVAREKWNRRKERIHWDNILVKFSQMNGCTEEMLKDFDRLPYSNKFVFTTKERPDIQCAISYPKALNKEEIDDDTTFFARGIPLLRFLNGHLWD